MLFFLAGLSIAKKVNIDRSNTNKPITILFTKLLSTKPVTLANAKIGIVP